MLKSNQSSNKTVIDAVEEAFISMQDFEDIGNHPNVIFAKHLLSGISILVHKKLETQTALVATIEFAEATTGIPKETWGLYSEAVVASWIAMEGI